MITNTYNSNLGIDNLLSVSKMEMKLFVSGIPDEVQQQVNDWLQENEVQIQHIGQSQSEKNGRFVFIISVFFQRA